MKNKKAIILIITLVLTIIGISYAAYTFVFTGGTNTLSTSDISLEFLESNSNIINITNALPMGCMEGKQQPQTFDFAVTSKTTRNVNIKYTLSIQKLSVDSGYTAFNDDQIALYLTDYTGTNELLPSNYRCSIILPGEGNKVSNPVDEYKDIKPMLLANTDTGHISLVSQLNNYKLYTGTHTHDATHQTVQDKFKLRVWIAPDVDASSWNASTKLQYKFKIGLSSEEKQPSAYPEVVYRYGTNEVSIGDSLEIATMQGYCEVNTNEGYNSCTDDNFGFIEQQDCLTDIDGRDGVTCEAGSWTEGVGTYTEDYTALNKNFFLKHNISSEGTVESSEVCYILNNNEYCLKGGDGGTAYSENTSKLQNSFGQANCSVDSSRVNCSASGLDAHAYSNGDVNAVDDSSTCYVNAFGHSRCGEL
jgi:hypothetical protein